MEVVYMKEMAMYDQPYYVCVYARAHLPYDEWPAGDRGKGRVA